MLDLFLVQRLLRLKFNEVLSESDTSLPPLMVYIMIFIDLESLSVLSIVLVDLGNLYNILQHLAV